MNYTADELGNELLALSPSLDNSSNLQTDESFDMDVILPKLRELHIREYYGEHYELMFNVTCAVCIIGYVTNTLNVIVFSRTSLSNSMNLFLLLLSVSDIGLITTSFAHIINYFAGYTLYPFYSHYIFYLVCTFFESIFDNTSNWFVATVAIWRYVAITWPQRCTHWFKISRVKIIVILIVTFSVLLAFPMFLVLTYETYQYHGYVLYEKTWTDFAKMDNHTPLKVYWGFLLLRSLVPMIVMIVMTGGLIWNLYTSKQAVDKTSASHRINIRITIMLIVLLTLFLLSNLPDSFLLLITLVSDGNSDLQESYRNATDFIRVFMLTNNCLSFFIYYGLGQEFRRESKKLFCSRRGKETDENSVAESTVGNVEQNNHCGDGNNVSHQIKMVNIN